MMVNKYFRNLAISPKLWEKRYQEEMSAAPRFVRHYSSDKRHWEFVIIIFGLTIKLLVSEPFTQHMWRYAYLFRSWHNLALQQWRKVSKNEIFIDISEVFRVKVDLAGSVLY